MYLSSGNAWYVSRTRSVASAPRARNFSSSTCARSSASSAPPLPEAASRYDRSPLPAGVSGMSSGERFGAFGGTGAGGACFTSMRGSGGRSACAATVVGEGGLVRRESLVRFSRKTTSKPHKDRATAPPARRRLQTDPVVPASFLRARSPTAIIAARPKQLACQRGLSLNIEAHAGVRRSRRATIGSPSAENGTVPARQRPHNSMMSSASSSGRVSSTFAP